MRRKIRLLAALGAVLLGVGAPLSAQEKSDPESLVSAPFDAAAAWDEFETILRGKYAYIERDDIDVEAQFARSRLLALKATDRAALRRILHHTALTFMDPHLIVGPLADDDFAVVMTAADLHLRFDGGTARVIDVRRGSPAFVAGIRPEDRVLSIDGVSADEASRLPFGAVLPEPNPAQRDYGLMLAANGRRSGARTLVVVPKDSAARTMSLANTRDFANSLRNSPPIVSEFVGKRGEIAVLRPLNSLGENATITAFDRALGEAIAAGAKAVVLDMRETPSGGNTEVARSIIGHFVKEVRPYQMHRVPALTREFTVPRQFVEYVFPRAPQFDGPVYVLHGKWTGSMGEGIVIGMDAATDAVTIGSDMGDLLGGLWNFDLAASGARIDLGGESLFHIDGTPREDYVADIPLEPAGTAPDGSDPAMAKAVALYEAGAGAD